VYPSGKEDVISEEMSEGAKRPFGEVILRSGLVRWVSAVLQEVRTRGQVVACQMIGSETANQEAVEAEDCSVPEWLVAVSGRSSPRGRFLIPRPKPTG